MHESDLEGHIEAIERDGYTILENIVPAELVSSLKKRVREIEAESIGPPTELTGEDADYSFVRTSGLLRLDPIFHQVPIHPEVLQLVEGVLGKDCLLSTFSGLDVEPGKSNTQPLHPDDALIPLSRPHERPIGCTAMWVLTDFNAHTGGTRLIPGSQRDSLDLLFSQDPEAMAGLIQPDVAAGSVLVIDHAIMHGSANNHSDEWRLGLQVSYHAGWIRPFTNWFRSIPVEEVATYPERLADLLGYKVYAGGIGSVNTQMGSYRESYSRLRAPGDPRLPLS